ncbi:DUF427-domain-containing protein [Mycena belliarum]|uniref:DUF427-domain-containing protein n=1 Tax=Mycena belliarum TaxID=1033014 RepID=A0AAD6UMJ7_9AGAR|nr:DUF427-domain-containing protein [Mycena belliae]
MAPPFTDAQGHIEDSPKRIRVLFGGTFVVDTLKAKLVWEHRYYPTYFFPQSELAPEHMRLAAAHPDGDGDKYDLTAGPHTRAGAVTVYGTSHPRFGGLLKIEAGAADAWFEEDEEIFGHPKDPYKRVDVLCSSRHVRVEVDGVEVANSRAPRLLFETGLPVRSYLPKTDCRLDLLVPSDLVTACPYKGQAQYYHVQVSPEKRVENIVWWYRNPNLECAAIGGLVAFYDEKVDVWVDGVKQARAQSKFS